MGPLAHVVVIRYACIHAVQPRAYEFDYRYMIFIAIIASEKSFTINADGKSLANMSFVLKEAISAGVTVPVASPAQLVQRGTVDVEAID